MCLVLVLGVSFWLALRPILAHAEPNPALEKWGPIVQWFDRNKYRPDKNMTERELEAVLKTTNSRINAFKYQRDKVDRWKNPNEFMGDGGGDCEDFAIAKMHSLAILGVPLDKMEIWILSRNSIQAHAVLAVLTESGVIILDNERDDVYSEEELSKNFKPRYAVSIEGWRKL